MRKSWQINQEILALLAGGDRRITQISNGCCMNSVSAYAHLGKLVEEAAVVYVEGARVWRITHAGKEMLRRLEARV